MSVINKLQNDLVIYCVKFLRETIHHEIISVIVVQWMLRIIFVTYNDTSYELKM